MLAEHHILKCYLMLLTFLSVLENGKAHNADLIRSVKSKLKAHLIAWNSHTQTKKREKAKKMCIRFALKL